MLLRPRPPRNEARPRPIAMIIGGSSGIGEALARELAGCGWRIVLLARRVDRLERVAIELGSETVIRAIDLAEPDAAAEVLESLIQELNEVDLVVISAGTGFLNPDLDWKLDRTTLTVNVVGFAAVAQVAMRHFLHRRVGHLVGISSIAGIRGLGESASYAASKAFVSNYLDGLRSIARLKGANIAVTEVQPGFVNTAMMKAKRPFWIAPPELTARQIARAIRKRSKHIYTTRRWALIAFLLRRMPRPG